MEQMNYKKAVKTGRYLNRIISKLSIPNNVFLGWQEQGWHCLMFIVPAVTILESGKSASINTPLGRLYTVCHITLIIPIVFTFKADQHATTAWGQMFCCQ